MSELRRRNVVKNALLYLATSWLLLQTAELLFPALRIETWAFPMLIGLLTLFFFPALIFSWVYELTADGLKLEKEIDKSAQGEDGSQDKIASGIKIDRVIVVLLIVAIAAVAFDRLVPETMAVNLGDEGEAGGKSRDGLISAQKARQFPKMDLSRCCHLPPSVMNRAPSRMATASQSKC
jgi:hypothetical protein